ncbi:MAG: hypothetical protein ACE5FF_01855 [Saprospiraceae bacterium]
MKSLIFFALCVLASVPASAQLEKTLHQTFDLADAKSLSIDVLGEYTIEPWASSYLMTETHVALFGASPSILTHFVEEEQRYLLDSEINNGQFKLVNHNNKREDAHTHLGTLTEVVKVKIFVPEKFLPADGSDTIFIKKEDPLSKQ